MNDGAIPQTLLTIYRRRSCRAFHSKPIAEEHVRFLVDAMRWAPSAGNRQPWHFYQVTNVQLRRGLVGAAGGQEFLAQAPLVFVVCTVPTRSAQRYGSRGENLYVYQDTAAAVENLLLAATALGYGTCWVGAFDETAVRAVLEIPDALRPVALVPVGVPAENPEPPRRMPVNEIVTIKE